MGLKNYLMNRKDGVSDRYKMFIGGGGEQPDIESIYITTDDKIYVTSDDKIYVTKGE